MATTHIHHMQPSVMKPFDKCYLGRKFLFGSRIQTYQNPVPTLRRRVFVCRVWDALTSGNSVVMAIRKGMLLFRQWSLTRQFSLILARKHIFGKGGCLYIILIGMRKVNINSV